MFIDIINNKGVQRSAEQRRKGSICQNNLIEKEALAGWKKGFEHRLYMQRSPNLTSGGVSLLFLY
jgi:hypothetical protein